MCVSKIDEIVDDEEGQMMTCCFCGFSSTDTIDFNPYFWIQIGKARKPVCVHSYQCYDCIFPGQIPADDGGTIKVNLCKTLSK